MSDLKITELTAVVPSLDDLIPTVDDPSGSPVTKKTTIGDILRLAYPIGSVYTSVVSTSPATLFGFGTWSAFATGRVLVGIDAGQTEFDVVEETGGAKTHTLLTTEIPSHTHIQDSHNHTQNAHSHTQRYHSATTGGLSGLATAPDTSSNTVTDYAQTTANTTATNIATTATNQNAGGGGAHNNLQPYIVVYMWKRTA